MYAARGKIQDRTGKSLDGRYFTQTLLPDFIAENPALTASWKVVFDARGHLVEPHTNRPVPLGTLEVESYLRSLGDPYLLEPTASMPGIETSGPSGPYEALLFCEKEGFNRLRKKGSILTLWRDSIPLVWEEISMRGGEVRSGSLFSYVDLEARVRRTHPLRTIRTMVDAALARLDGDFEAIYAPIGRPSIPPEQLLRALLLQAFYTVRSERQLMEQLDYSLLFRWFVGLGIDDPVWDVTVFTKNRDRLLGGEIASKFFGAILDDARIEGLLSDEHFSVDGTLIQAWASMKSFRPKDGSGEPPAEGRNGERDFKGEKRSNETHRSTTDDDARLFRKGDGQASQLCFIGHVLMENRNGLAVEAELTRAAGAAERLAALTMAENLPAGHKTLGADKGYDTQRLRH